MSAALPTAGLDELPRLVRLLLTRGHERSLLAVVRRFHELPPAVQREVVRRSDLLTRAMREAIALRPAGAERHRQGGVGSAAMAGVLGSLEIVERSRRGDLAYLAGEALHHPSVKVRRRAAMCLEHLARRCRTRTAEGRPPRMGVKGAGHIVEAVMRAVAAYPVHRQEGVLLAWLWLLPRVGWSATRDDKAVGRDAAPEASLEGDKARVTLAGLTRLLEAAKHPAARRALPATMLIEPLRDAARAGLARAISRGDRLPLELAHLLHAASPPPRNMTPPKPAPASGSLATSHHARHLPAILRQGGVAGQPLIEHLESLAASDDPAARASAVRTLTATATATDPRHDAAVRRAVAAFVTDPEPAVARAALRWLRAADHEALPTLLVRAMNTGRAELIDFARPLLAQASFERLWSRWDRLEPAGRRAAVEALVKLDDDLASRIETRIGGGTCGERLRAVAMLRAAGAGRGDERAGALLARLVEDADPRVAAAAGAVMSRWESMISAEDRDANAHRPGAEPRPTSLASPRRQQRASRVYVGETLAEVTT